MDPRGTSDIDVNVFVPAQDAAPGLAALPTGVGQVRLWWDDTPLDLFFDYAPVHADAARHRRTVPFAETRIPVLGPVELAVFKAMFDRTRDWADIEAMIAAGSLDVGAARSALQAMLDEDDSRFARLEAASARAEPSGGV